MKTLFAFVPMMMLLTLATAGCGKEPAVDNPNDTIAHEDPTPLEPYYEQCLFRPEDYNSKNWRIPAIRVLQDGSLIAFSDKRKYNESDLPEDIDIVYRHSTDCGRTWTEPQNLAVGTGYKHGFGDCAVVQCLDGTVVVAYVGGNGLWQSSGADPQHSYIARSTDGGRTFGEPMDVTAQLWGSNADNALRRNYTGAFFGSGNGLLVTEGDHRGRIIFVSAMVKGSRLDNYAVYSDDNGLTWQVSDKAYTGGDEAKTVQLSNGNILMSVRQTGERGYVISTDGGATWGTQKKWSDLVSNACNGDIIRYNHGGHNFLLHSLPNSMNREDVALFISRDEGKTWQMQKVLCPGRSCYSSLSVLPDGRIAFYVERDIDNDGKYELWYQCFTIDWLLSE